MKPTAIRNPSVPLWALWDESEVEILSIMPDRQVQECEIQLPSSVQDDWRLTREVHQCIRGMKDEVPFVEAELVEDLKKCLSFDELREREESHRRYRRAPHL